MNKLLGLLYINVCFVTIVNQDKKGCNFFWLQLYATHEVPNGLFYINVCFVTIVNQDKKGCNFFWLQLYATHEVPNDLFYINVCFCNHCKPR